MLLQEFEQLLSDDRSDEEIETWFSQSVRNHWSNETSQTIHNQARCTTIRKRTLIKSAISANNVEFVEFLLKTATRCCTFCSNGDILPHAIRLGNEDIVELLIAAGFDVNQKDPHGEIPLNIAISANEDGIALMLLNAGAYRTKELNSDSQTPLHLAVMKSEIDLIRRLAEDKVIDIDAKDRFGKNAVYYAITERNCEITKLLVDLGASTDLSQLQELRPFITSVISRGDLELFNFLSTLNTGVDLINTRETTMDRKTPLQFAAQFHEREIAKELVKRGADINVVSDRYGADLLYFIAAEPRGAFVREEYLSHVKWFLMLEGFDTDYSSPNAHMIPGLGNALAHGDEEVLDILTHRRRLDLTLFDPQQVQFLIQRAAENRYTDRVLKTFFQKVPFDVNVALDFGGTLLHKSITAGSTPCVKFLLKKGADLAIKDRRGSTPLHIDVRNLYREMMHLSPPHVANFNGEDLPLEVASENDDDIMKCLIRHLVIREFTGQKTTSDNSQIIQSSGELLDLYRNCQDELRSLRASKISDSLSLFHVLTNDKRYANNSLAVAVFADGHFGEFPLYRDILTKNIQKQRKRARLVGRAAMGLERLSGYDREAFHLVFERICEYLDRKSLRNLALL